MSTLNTIRPILRATYGSGCVVNALAEHLAGKIDSYAPRHDRDSREDMVMRVCWDWMPGGSTAGHVAAKIEAALCGRDESEAA